MPLFAQFLRRALRLRRINPRNTQCIPVVKIIDLLELEQKLTFCKGLTAKLISMTGELKL